MANINDTDKFLVNRSNTSYQLEAQNLMAELQDTDLMLVNRDGTSYKATGADIKDSLKPPAEVIKPQIIAPANGAGSEYTPESDTITNVTFDTLSGTYEIKTGDQGLSNPGHETANYNPTTWSSAAYVGTATIGTRPSTGGSGKELMYKLPRPEAYLPFVRYVGTLDDGYTFAIWGSNDGINYVHLSTIKGIDEPPSNRLNSGPVPYQYFVFRQWGPSDGFGENSAVNNYGISTDIPESYNIYLASEKDLDKFELGMACTQSDSNATGSIAQVFKAGNSSYVHMSNITGTWAINNTIIGSPTLSGDAGPDPSGVNFVGTTFASTDGSLLPASADWQVAIYNPGEADDDPTYSSPISQVSKHPDMTPAPQWTAGELEGETEYRARTKYYATTGQESPWSNDITFKTDSGIKDIVATPGDAYMLLDNGSLSPFTAPVKLVNIQTTSQSSFTPYLAVGVDGKLYGASAGTTGTFTNSALYAGDDLLDVWTSYSAVNGACYLFLKSSGAIEDSDGEIIHPGGGNFVKLIKLGGVSNVVIVQDDIGQYFFYGQASKYIGTFTPGTGNRPNNTRYFGLLTLSGLPAGVTVSGLCGIGGNYDAQHLAILGSDNKIYCSGTDERTQINGGSAPDGFPWGGTNTAPIPTTGAAARTDWSRMAVAAACYGTTNRSLSFLTKSGDLYALSIGENAINRILGIDSVQLTQINGKYNSCIVASYEKNHWCALSDSKQLLQAKQSTVTTPVAGISVAGSWNSLGTLPGSTNRADNPFVIIPD